MIITKKNLLPFLSIVVIVGAVAIAIFSLKQAESVKNSDDITSIETELNATNLDNLDMESSEIGSLLK